MATQTSTKFCVICGQSIHEKAEFCPHCGVRQPGISGSKNKTTAGILALFLGGLGVHKFYLGQIGMGIIYILFSWTFIPLVIGAVEGVIYLTMSDEAFAQKYG